MTTITTVSQLRAAWDHIGSALLRDVLHANRLRIDPVGTFLDFGYVLSPPAHRALLSALP